MWFVCVRHVYSGLQAQQTVSLRSEGRAGFISPNISKTYFCLRLLCGLSGWGRWGRGGAAITSSAVLLSPSCSCSRSQIPLCVQDEQLILSSLRLLVFMANCK